EKLDDARTESPAGQKRQEVANLFFAGLASVFRDFKSLGMLDTHSLRAVALLQSLSPLRLEFPLPAHGRSKPFLALRGILRHLLELPLGPWQPLIELRHVGVQHIDFFLEHIVN